MEFFTNKLEARVVMILAAIILFLCVLIGVGLWYTHMSADKKGYTRATKECSASLTNADLQYQKRINDIRKQYATNIINVPDTITSLHTQQDTDTQCGKLRRLMSQSQCERNQPSITTQDGDRLGSQESDLPSIQTLPDIRIEDFEYLLYDDYYE